MKLWDYELAPEFKSHYVGLQKLDKEVAPDVVDVCPDEWTCVLKFASLTMRKIGQHDFIALTLAALQRRITRIQRASIAAEDLVSSTPARQLRHRMLIRARSQCRPAFPSWFTPARLQADCNITRARYYQHVGLSNPIVIASHHMHGLSLMRHCGPQWIQQG